MNYTANLITHRTEPRIAVQFENNKELIARFKLLPGARWSATLKCWHLPDTEENRKRFNLLKVPPFEKKEPLTKEENATPIPENKNEIIKDERIIPFVKKLTDKAKLKGYSENTVRNYVSHFTEFLKVFINKKEIDEITKDEIERYLIWRQSNNTYSESYQNSHINAIKFYYEYILDRNRMLFDLPRPKRGHQLPAVWAETDVIKMLGVIGNLKHQTMFIVAYAHGMRVSEVADLKLADIDSKRMQIHIKAGKGKKDRIVNLSETALEFLREYYKKYKPKVHVFENDLTHEAISIRTIQQIFQDAKKKAGLLKKAGIHSLRHSYATHLHEQGVDIKYLKDLLGHTSIKTTERYTHVSKKDISKITSPLDKLKLKRDENK